MADGYKTAQGDSFVVRQADEFATEVGLLRGNHRFLSMLDKFKKNGETIPLEEVEKQLR